MPTPPDALSDSPSRPRRADDILDGLRARGIRPGTGTILRVLEALGDPHLQMPLVLVAGTNGKGTTAALLASISHAAKQRTGLFTSPAIERTAEQIQISGEEIASEPLAALLEQVVETGERLAPNQLTAFEALTAAALLHFARAEVTLAICEVGLGGRGDATNVAADHLAIVTFVGLDHQAFLGADLAAIAREKAGILRAGQPAVIGWLPRPAQRAVEEEAERIGAHARFAARSIRTLARTPRGLAGQQVQITTGRRSYTLFLPLLGEHQARNLALAVLAAECLEDKGLLRLEADTVNRGVAACRWPGRLEPIRLTSTTTLLLDAAHNTEGMAVLRSFLDELGQPFLLVFGALRDKPVTAMLGLLAPVAQNVLLAPVDDARSWGPADGVDAIPGLGRAGDAATTTCHPNVEAALDHAWALAASRRVRASSTDALLIVACGSLRVVAESHQWLASREDPREDSR